MTSVPVVRASIMLSPDLPAASRGGQLLRQNLPLENACLCCPLNISATHTARGPQEPYSMASTSFHLEINFVALISAWSITLMQALPTRGLPEENLRTCVLTEHTVSSCVEQVRPPGAREGQAPVSGS